MQTENSLPELVLVGINHRVARLELRERLAVGVERLPLVLRDLTAQLHPAVTEPVNLGGEAADMLPAEVVLLSTCNRTEIYLATTHPQWASLKIRDWLSAFADIPQQKLAGTLYQQRGEAAACHLLRVAAGMESLLPGENEIQGQVRRAFEASLQAGSAGAHLTALFQAALRAGKRVRAETGLGQTGRSLAKLVVDLAREICPDLRQQTALLIGAGKISSLAAQALVRAGLSCVLVANRTYPRACQLAASLGAERARAVHFDALPEGLASADIVICSTGAPHLVLHADLVRQALALRPERPLLVADLAVPRDVDPQIGLLQGVRLVDIDGLQELVQRRYPLAFTTRQAAEAIVQQEMCEYSEWRRVRRAAPLISALRAHADRICDQQVQHTLRRLGPLSPEQQQQVRRMAQAISAHLLHAPIAHLKSLTDDETVPGFDQLVETLFDLPRR